MKKIKIKKSPNSSNEFTFKNKETLLDKIKEFLPYAIGGISLLFPLSLNLNINNLHQRQKPPTAIVTQYTKETPQGILKINTLKAEEIKDTPIIYVKREILEKAFQWRDKEKYRDWGEVKDLVPAMIDSIRFYSRRYLNLASKYGVFPLVPKGIEPIIRIRVKSDDFTVLLPLVYLKPEASLVFKYKGKEIEDAYTVINIPKPKLSLKNAKYVDNGDDFFIETEGITVGGRSFSPIEGALEIAKFEIENLEKIFETGNIRLYTFNVGGVKGLITSAKYKTFGTFVRIYAFDPYVKGHGVIIIPPGEQLKRIGVIPVPVIDSTFDKGIIVIAEIEKEDGKTIIVGNGVAFDKNLPPGKFYDIPTVELSYSATPPSKR